MMEKECDNTVSEVHEKDSREKSDIIEELGNDSPKASNCDSLNMSQSNCHVQPEEEENMTEEGSDNAGSEVHKGNSRETPDIDEAFGSGSSEVSDRDSLNVSQSNRHVEEGKQIAKMVVAQGSKYQRILSDSS
eukprot:13843749-Ditylum_brightwellii.AAC.1